jgi:hypothetical protein
MAEVARVDVAREEVRVIVELSTSELKTHPAIDMTLKLLVSWVTSASWVLLLLDPVLAADMRNRDQYRQEEQKLQGGW